MLRIGWKKAQAKFVAEQGPQVIQARENGPSYVLQVWDFMPGPTASRRVS